MAGENQGWIWFAFIGVYVVAVTAIASASGKASKKDVEGDVHTYTAKASDEANKLDCQTLCRAKLDLCCIGLQDGASRFDCSTEVFEDNTCVCGNKLQFSLSC